MNKYNFLFLLLALFSFSQYTYAGPSSFTFRFYNNDPGKIVYVWMYGYPKGGTITNAVGQTIPYPGQADPIFIAQDPGQDGKNGIEGHWVVEIKNANNQVDCAVKLDYKMQKNILKPKWRRIHGHNHLVLNKDRHWNQGIKFSSYSHYSTCPFANLSWKRLPKPKNKIHGTRFYRVMININNINKVYFMPH